MDTTRRLWIGAVLLVPTLAVAQPPAGGEIQVNGYTTGDQRNPGIARYADGFVVTWTSYGSDGGDTSASSIQARLYEANGVPGGAQFQVNTYTTGDQNYPAVGPDGSGGFVVAWTSYGATGDPHQSSIQARRYAADGSPAGGQFQVNTYTSGEQYGTAVSEDGAGGFVVVWTSYGSSGSDNFATSIQAQRYSADGAPAGGELQVNTYTTNIQGFPAVAPDGAGGFVVIWHSTGSGGTDQSGFSVQGQRYDADGLPVDGEFQVNTVTTGYQLIPAAAPDGAGGFVVTWASAVSGGDDTSGYSVQARRYAAAGQPLGDEFQVNTYTPSLQGDAAVMAHDAGGFVVTWTSDGSSASDTSGYSVQARRYGADGTSQGDEFQVNTYTPGFQALSTVASDGFGGFVVTWTGEGSAGDTSGYAILAQRYSDLLFADGFESGNTSAWSATVP